MLESDNVKVAKSKVAGYWRRHIDTPWYINIVGRCKNNGSC